MYSYCPSYVVPAHWKCSPLLRRLVSINFFFKKKDKNQSYTASEKAAIAVQKTWSFILGSGLGDCSRPRRLIEYGVERNERNGRIYIGC